MNTHKIGLVGAGNIGGWLAQLLINENLGTVALYDKAPGLAEGKALDLTQSLAIDGRGGMVVGSDDASCLQGSDILVITAGLARQPGMSREDLLDKNVNIFCDLAKDIKKYAPEAIIIVVTNPLDLMVWVMQRLTGFPAERVVGMAGILDSGRFRLFLSSFLDICPSNIQTMVLGGHGDLMVPLLRYTTIQGIPLKEWMKLHHIDMSALEPLVARTRQGGAELVSLLKRGSAYAGPAASCLDMVRAVLCDAQRVLPCAAMLRGEYGCHDIYAGVPVVLGRTGVKRVISLELTPDEQEAFQQSAQRVQALTLSVEPLLATCGT